MANTTGILRYNLNQRGRKFSGVPRSYNVAAIVANINSPAVQERVRNRDMLGYYGHWPRRRLGMNPAEGGVIDGKVVQIEPAFVTTKLKAYDDGTIEHEAEFFDNAPGEASQRARKNKFGGFSSAIMDEKNAFYGFDYVFQPNYTANRPYALALDSAADDPNQKLTFDEVNNYLDSVESTLNVVMLLDSMNVENKRLAKKNSRLEMQLIDMEKELERVTSRGLLLDSAAALAGATRHNPMAALLTHASEFRDMVGIQKPKATFDQAYDRDEEFIATFVRR